MRRPRAAPFPREFPLTATIPAEQQQSVPTSSSNHDAAGLLATNVSAWFSKRKVLERCSLDMEPRRVTALIGPSGCGKSTFIRILNRMHEVIPGAQVAGRIELDGTDIYGTQLSATQVRTKIGMVFQKPNPFPAMTIQQ